MEVLNAILHKIDKEPGNKEVHVDKAPKELSIDATIKRISSQARKLYKGHEIYGVFQEDKKLYTFQVELEKCTNNEWSDFHDFTNSAMDILNSSFGVKFYTKITPN